MITIALAVDEDVRWSVIVPTSSEKNTPLQRLYIKTEQGAGSETLETEKVADLAEQFDRVQSHDLAKGVYFITTDASLRYEDLKQVRVYVHGGKDPWPPPPPPAPQGTDLEKYSAVYKQGIDKVLVTAGDSSRWIEVKSLALPKVV